MINPWKRKFSRLPMVVRRGLWRTAMYWLYFVLGLIGAFGAFGGEWAVAVGNLILAGLITIPLLALDRRLFLHYTIDCDRVRSDGRGVRDNPVWQEPLANYLGIRFYRTPNNNPHIEATLGLPASNDAMKFYYVELAHDDPARDVTLFTSKFRYPAEGVWKTACETLGLAPIDGPAAELSYWVPKGG